MILSFNKRFVKPILDDTKIHTIRKDKYNRWYPGRLIQMATGIRTSKYHQFNQDTCKSVQAIRILWDDGQPCILMSDTADEEELMPFYFPNGYGEEQMKQLVKNDGFDSGDEFFKWFNTDFNGKIIHWTDFRYKIIFNE